jgi:hypothetical protein
VWATQGDADEAGTHWEMCLYQGHMRKHHLIIYMWLIKPLQRSLRIMR